MKYIIIILILGCIVIPILHYLRNIKLLYSVSSLKRGTKAERKLVVRMLRKGVRPDAIFHDLYLQKRNGEFSQIDIVVATPQGLLAIEVKDYSGWLFGNEKQQYWTKVLNYGKEKYRFYNPIMQNAGHIKALREQSEQLAHLPIFNVVLFAGNCTLKNVNYWAYNTFVGYANNINYVLKKIKKFPLAQYTDTKGVVRLLSQAVENGNNPEIIARHLDFVRRNCVGDPPPVISGGNRLFRLIWRRLIKH